MTGTLSFLSLAWIPFPAFFLIRLGSILRCFTQFFRQRNLVNALVQEVFNGLELLLFLFTHERYGTSVVISTCRTPDAMHIILAIIGHIVIDDQTDIVNVNPS